MTDDDELKALYITLSYQIYGLARIMLWYGVNVAYRIDTPFQDFTLVIPDRQ